MKTSLFFPAIPPDFFYDLRRCLAVMTCMLAGFLANGQSALTGQVIDAGSGEPVPFVNIGILQKPKGTVSDQDGNFRLEGVLGKDSVAFSSIGYKRAAFRIADLEPEVRIRLKPKVYEMGVVEVESELPGKLEIFGYQIKKKKQSVQYGSAQLGTEMAAHLKIRGKTWIKSAHFILNHAKGDSMFFRVNIYDFGKGKVGENLLRENVLIQQPQETGTLSVDLRPYQVIIEDDVLLSLEWIHDDDEKGNEGISFRCRLLGAENTYTREASLAPFKKVSELAPMAPGLQLGFYLAGKKIR